MRNNNILKKKKKILIFCCTAVPYLCVSTEFGTVPTFFVAVSFLCVSTAFDTNLFRTLNDTLVYQQRLVPNGFAIFFHFFKKKLLNYLYLIIFRYRYQYFSMQTHSCVYQQRSIPTSFRTLNNTKVYQQRLVPNG